MFSKELTVFNASYNKDFVQFNGSFPKTYACPAKDACLGGLRSKCISGYEGPLCAVCSKGHYKLITRCQPCPTVPWLVGQITIVLIIFIVVFGLLLKDKKNKQPGERSVTDMLLARLKIIIGFYQVTGGILDSFTDVPWPQAMITLGKYAKFLQLNLVQIVPLHCFKENMKIDSYTSLTFSILFNTSLVVLMVFLYQIRKLILKRKESREDAEKIKKKISESKEWCYRNMFLILFITYPATCTQILQILPSACQKICSDHEELSCHHYLKADFSTECFTPKYNIYMNMARVLTVFIVGFPLLVWFLLYKYHYKVFLHNNNNNNNNNNNIQTGCSNHQELLFREVLNEW